MPNIRLLICRNCQTTDVVPDYDGDPRNDTELEYVLQKHEFPNGERHFGRLYRGIDESLWSRSEKREEILKQIWQQEGHTGMEPWVYQAVDQLKADAMTCWRSRQRPEKCADFHSDKKILIPPTQAERKSEGVGKWDKSNPGAQRYLCDYCPIRSVAQTMVWEKKGLYK